MSTNRKGISPAWTLAALPVIALLLGGCAQEGPRPQGPRLVVLYSTCTLRKDFLSPYEEGIGFTPNLQALAQESVVFERHNTEAGQSGVAFASIYSGLQADRHGVYHHPRHLPEELFLVSEAFQGNGYETHFWSGQPMAAALLRYGQGVPEEHVYNTHVDFTPQAKELPEGFFAATTGNGPELDALLDRMSADPDLAAFLQINFTITHELYHEYADLEKIEAFRSRFPSHATDLTRAEIDETLRFFEANRHVLQLDHRRAVRELDLTAADVARLDQVLQLAYRACVEQLDRYLGRFLQRVETAGLSDELLFVFTADHGETFYEETEPLHWMHGLQLAPDVLDVPLIVRAPGLTPARYAGVTRSTDVYPTLAGLASLRLPSSLELEGTDLSRALTGEREPPDLIAFSHTSTLGKDRIQRYKKQGYGTVVEMIGEPDPRHMWVRMRQGDLVLESRPEPDGGRRTLAFDLALDRARANDLFDPADPRHARMQKRLASYRRRLIQAYDGTETMSQREMLEGLRGIGYIGDE